MNARFETTYRRRAFSLIEILVVIVVLLIGVLSFVRLFPRAFVGLGVTRDHTMAQTLARRQLDALEAGGEDLPKQILAVRFVANANPPGYLLVADPDVSPRDLGPGGELLENGNIAIDYQNFPNSQIFWRYYNDANRIRRVIGEGGRVPAPKPVGSDFGSLRVLNFGPVVNLPNLLLVYGNDMEGRATFGSPAGGQIRNPSPWQFVHDDEVPQLWLPGVANRPIRYKVNFSYWDSGGPQGYRRVDVIDVVLTVTANPVGNLEARYDSTNNEVYPFDLRAIANSATWLELVHGSVTAARLFDEIPLANVFSPNYPYEYKVLNGNLGMLLFNPAGYNYRERRGRRGDQPLVAQVNYDVFNWHIIREDFRGDRTRSTLQKLTLNRVKSVRDLLNDGRRYPGMDVPVPDGLGGLATDRDFVVLDMDTGGIVSPRVDPATNSPLCYKVDYLRGVIALGSPFLPDPQGNPNELAQSITIILPDAAQTLMTNVDPAGRNLRVLYQAHNDWAVQLLKASQRYTVLYGLPLGIAQCYVGGSDGINGQPTRLYFPAADIGAKVTVREIWYRDNANNLKAMRDQDLLIRSARGDVVGSHADIREIDPTAAGFDFQTYGYAVRGVSGSSMRARTLWNNSRKDDVTGDGVPERAERMRLHEEWGAGWRSVEVESHLTRRDRN